MFDQLKLRLRKERDYKPTAVEVELVLECLDRAVDELRYLSSFRDANAQTKHARQTLEDLKFISERPF